MNSRELLHKAYQLSIENPDLEIKVFVDNETIADDYSTTE